MESSIEAVDDGLESSIAEQEVPQSNSEYAEDKLANKAVLKHLAEPSRSTRTTKVTTNLPALTKTEWERICAEVKRDKAEWRKLEFEIDISYPHDDENEETKRNNSLHLDEFDSSDEVIRAQAMDTDNPHTIPLPETPRTNNIHEMIDQLMQPTTVREQNQQQILLKFIKHYLNTTRRVRRFRGNSEGSPQPSANVDGDSRKGKAMAIVDVLAEREDDYELPG